MKKLREKRLRRLLRWAGQTRRSQARKIDILCNDIVTAHRDFIRQLRTFSFVVNFYESILACNDLKSLFIKVGEHIGLKLPDTNVAIFVAGADSFDVHTLKADCPIPIDFKWLQDSFNFELVDSISKVSRVCRLDDIVGMGLNIDYEAAGKICLAAIPFYSCTQSRGFILICRAAEREITLKDLEKISAVTPGLAKAVESYRFQTC